MIASFFSTLESLAESASTDGDDALLRAVSAAPRSAESSFASMRFICALSSVTLRSTSVTISSARADAASAALMARASKAATLPFAGSVAAGEGAEGAFEMYGDSGHWWCVR